MLVTLDLLLGPELFGLGLRGRLVRGLDSLLGFAARVPHVICPPLAASHAASHVASHTGAQAGASPLYWHASTTACPMSLPQEAETETAKDSHRRITPAAQLAWLQGWQSPS